jgi:hypothetical protein
MLVYILLMNARRKLGLLAKPLCTFTPALGSAILLTVSRQAAPCMLQVLGRGPEAAARGAARCASHVLGRGAQAGTQAVACGDATLPQKLKSTWQMSIGAA